jgi:2-keto-3-deoxy-L-fuconate dehydrogenase
MAGRLNGKLALVTAAGQGIGRAIAEAFVAEGARVIATDLQPEKLAGLAGATQHKLDVRSDEDVSALARSVEREQGALDILVNSAGYVHHGTVLECQDADWDFSFDLNVKSMHRTLRAFLPGMLAKGRGSIVNIASVASSITGVPNRYVYGATKAAVIGLTKAVAADFIRRGIRCNAICPGTIQTPSLDERIEAEAKRSNRSLEDVRKDFVNRQRLGRLGTPAEIAACAVFLASDEASFVTGQPYIVDGGMVL